MPPEKEFGFVIGKLEKLDHSIVWNHITIITLIILGKL